MSISHPSHMSSCELHRERYQVTTTATAPELAMRRTPQYIMQQHGSRIFRLRNHDSKGAFDRTDQLQQSATPKTTTATGPSHPSQRHNLQQQHQQFVRQEDREPTVFQQQLQRRHKPSTAEPAIDQRLLQLQRSACKTSASPTTQLQRNSTSGNVNSSSGTTFRAL